MPDPRRPIKPAPAQPQGEQKPSPFADLLKTIVKKAKPGRKALKGRHLASGILAKTLGSLSGHASVVGVKTGVVTIEADSAPLFQEIEGYRRKELIEAFRAGGLDVREIRVKLCRAL